MLEEQVRQRTHELESALHENERMTRALRESEAKFQRLVEHSMVGITLTENFRFLYVNPMFCDITGYSEEELVEMNPVDLTTPAKREELAEMLTQGLNSEKEVVDYFTEIVRKDGTIVQVEITGGLPVSYNGKPVLINSIVDVTERIRAENEIKLLNAQLKEQVIRDPLTGLYNRRYMDDALVREFKRAERNGEKLSLVMCDLDHFKRINDKYGHQAGDEVLSSFARLLIRQMRGSDICCRFGGEEFLLLLFGINGDTTSERIERVRQSVQNEAVLFGEQALHVTASFGIAVYPDNGTSTKTLLASADVALYRAKSEGRNQICLV
jgi:diguanylate cyclase (GGDEF)-like protein/PAS domain S-box-containing protein